MFIAPLVIITVLVIAFPKLMRFVFGLLVFGALFMVASCIDHAHAENLSDRDALQRCLRVYAQTHADEIAKITAFGGSEALPAASACGGFMDTYVFHCQQRGRTASECYSDVREDAEQAIAN